MKKILSIFTILIVFSSNVFAADEDLDLEIKKIQTNWAISKYQSEDNDQKIAGFRKCAKLAEELVTQYSNSAKPLIWQGICLSSEAELTKLTALGKVKEAKKIFEKALKINETELEGSAYMNLAVLYHRVPGWPIAFGDKQISEEYFKKALEISPNNIDANYFYALFLADVKDDYQVALRHLEIALNAPVRNRPLADEQRRIEIRQKIEKFKSELN